MINCCMLYVISERSSCEGRRGVRREGSESTPQIWPYWSNFMPDLPEFPIGVDLNGATSHSSNVHED